MTTTPRPLIGIPYARADVDDKGYFVTCPECGETFYGTPKGSTKKYGVHYVKTHEDAR